MALGQMEMALGARAPDFRLPATDGRTYALKDVAGGKGTVIVFIRTEPPPKSVRRELVEAMRAIATTGLAPADQKASIGCSIKWKDE